MTEVAQTENMDTLHNGNGTEPIQQCDKEVKSPLIEQQTSLNGVKFDRIREAINSSDIVSLRALALDKGGLLSDGLRRKAWPILLSIDQKSPLEKPTEDEIRNHQYHEQVGELVSEMRSCSLRRWRRFPQLQSNL